MKKFFLLFAVSAVLFACDKDENKENKEKSYDSEKVTLHGGKVWTSAKVSKEGKPQQVSIILDDATLNSVPVGQPSDHTGHENNLMIPISTASGTPFKFAMVNWNSSGHEPDGVYTLPHFDFHFYTSAQTEVMNYTDMAKANIAPAADYIPANHFGGDPVPMMGKHWVDLTSPELTGQAPFTQTFIYGSYDGKVVFYEPMITLNFLKNTTEFERPIPQPSKFQASGYYPTKMKIKKKSGTTEVVLDGFVYRQAS
jgi:hypothetical protein